MCKYSNKNEIDFRNMLWKSGFTDTSLKGQQEIADYFSVTTRTIREWLRTNKVPQSQLDKLTDMTKTLNDEWSNFKIKGNKLFTPNGYSYTTKELESLAIEIELIKSKYK